jgi:hypothetical protein
MFCQKGFRQLGNPRVGEATMAGAFNRVKGDINPGRLLGVDQNDTLTMRQ